MRARSGWVATSCRGAIMSPLPAAMCTWDSLSVLGNSRRTSTEVGMMHWARWSATAAVAALVAAPLCGQGSGGVADPSPVAPPRAVVTNDMLTNAAASGDWLMYITSPATPNNIVRAFDLRTQKMLWEYTHKNDPVSTACCGPNNRGVAVSGGSVFLGTLDDNLVALDGTTGKVKWEVKVGDGPAAGYTETMA